MCRNKILKEFPFVVEGATNMATFLISFICIYKDGHEEITLHQQRSGLSIMRRWNHLYLM